MSGTSDKEQSCQSGDIRNVGLIPGLREDPLEKGMATYSSILAWRIPWTEVPGITAVLPSVNEHAMPGYVAIYAGGVWGGIGTIWWLRG